MIPWILWESLFLYDQRMLVAVETVDLAGVDGKIVGTSKNNLKFESIQLVKSHHLPSSLVATPPKHMTLYRLTTQTVC